MGFHTLDFGQGAQVKDCRYLQSFKGFDSAWCHMGRFGAAEEEVGTGYGGGVGGGVLANAAEVVDSINRDEWR